MSALDESWRLGAALDRLDDVFTPAQQIRVGDDEDRAEELAAYATAQGFTVEVTERWYACGCSDGTHPPARSRAMDSEYEARALAWPAWWHVFVIRSVTATAPAVTS